MISRLETVWDTYHQIVAELSPTEWVYAGLTSYVITHRELPSENEIIFTEKSPSNLVKELRNKEGKGVWICGGDLHTQSTDL